MKTLTTLAAAAALLTGIAAANAQSSMQSGSTNMTASGSSAWCLQDAGSTSSMNCKFASKDACQKEAKPQGQCIQNPKPGSTTGSGAGGTMKK